ncbi:prolyl oligopeptidase family serine peptidase [Streptomyces sp. H27-C3]|uniref:S9 family peptidase n=1 Tax=Streptomyces sp. H27-C3 TaxID=3046305 RepID=UPI0024B89D79|nr:prolyl oligopeptidase family serine peptidase [Streptomyces sp. H27-C3]MDJ0460327.1 prolyl oligopeptidase family serine peptidase [Streptomyces sp. H27-C3]
MPPEAFEAAGPGTPERETVHFRPDLSAWAVLGAAALPSVADHNPRTVHWRDLPVDPALVGVAPARARHADVVLGGPPASRPWRLPLRTVLAAGVAWHPELPLVAGLVQQGDRLHPWSADYTTRHLTVHQRVRAALSLTARRPGRPALSWCREGLLTLLTPPAPSASGPGPQTEGDRDQGWRPVVFEATGPGHVAFVPGLDELLRLAGASVSVLDPATGTLRTLTPPWLVGGLEPSPGGRGLLVEHATAADDGSAEQPSGSGDGLDWSRAVLRPDSGSWAPVPAVTRWAAGAGEAIASSRTVTGGTAIELRTAHDAEGRPPTAGPTITHEDDDPPVWWHCLTLGTATAVVSRHRTSLRLRSGEDYLRVPLPAALGRLGTPMPGHDGEGVVITCVQGGRAGFLRLAHGEREAGIAVEPPPGGDDGPLESSWTTTEDGVPHLLTRRAGRFDRYALRGERLRPVSGSTLPRLRPAPFRAPARTVSPTLVLSPPPGGCSARLTRVDGPGGESGGTARLLWIQVRRSTGDPAAADPPADLSGLRAPGWLLDLPLAWPPDVRPGDVRRQIVHAVGQAVANIREQTSREDPVVVGGHSFAATVALQALAHCPGLAGAIAHSGCYNRTLTPQGFQYERRSYWQVPGLYRALSALDFADRLTRPVLLVHGLDDTNVATPPDQAVALYRAVVANGGRARLVLLPHEGHVFRHRESLETVTREHEAWLAACVPLSARQADRSERT